MPNDPDQQPDPIDKSLGEQATGADVSRLAAHRQQSLGDQSTSGDALSSMSDLAEGLGEAFDLNLPLIDLAARFQIEGELGQGGMGAVLLATDRQLKRKVAIKRILGSLMQSKTALQRFVTEAQSIAALNHSNIVQIYEFGRDAEGPLLVLEYVGGGSLLDKLKDGKLEIDEAVDIVCRLCDALGKAHALGIIHRDIKPANILLTEDGAPKLTDFGLARQETADHGQTQAGVVLGTIDFMSPEQRRDATATDGRSDLWSLAATLYQMVTGKSPKIIKFRNVPQALQDVLEKALEDAPQDRYQTAAEFRGALQSSLTATAEPALEVRREEIDAQRLQAEALLKELAFEESTRIAEEIAAIEDSRLQHLKEWSGKFIESIPVEKKRQQENAAKQHLEAQEHRKAFDYKSAIQAMETIPEAMRTTEMSGYLKQLQADRQESHQLLQTIKDRLKRRDVDGIDEDVNRALELRGDRDDLHKLKSRLVAQQEKLIRRRDEAYAESEGGDDEKEEAEAIKQWYILKVQVNRENSIRDALERRSKSAGLERFIGDVVVPTEELAEFNKAGRRQIVKKKLFPGYIMVHMIINDDTWVLVRETPGIGDFTGAVGKPTPMDPLEVDRILKTNEEIEDSDQQVKTAIPFKAGDRVRVKDGYFLNFEGEVKGIDEANGRVTVMINIFGRSTPAELDPWQIENV